MAQSINPPVLPHGHDLVLVHGVDCRNSPLSCRKNENPASRA